MSTKGTLGGSGPAARFLFAICALGTAAIGQREALARLPQDAEVANVPLPGIGGVEQFGLPGEGLVHGVALLGEEIVLARGDQLLVLPIRGGGVRSKVPLPDGLLGLTADSK